MKGYLVADGRAFDEVLQSPDDIEERKFVTIDRYFWLETLRCRSAIVGE